MSRLRLFLLYRTRFYTTVWPIIGHPDSTKAFQAAIDRAWGDG